MEKLGQRLLRARQETDEFVLHFTVKIARGIPMRVAWRTQADEEPLTKAKS